VIVIFGAAVRPNGRPSTMLRRRIEAAAAFGTRFRAPLFLPTGGVGRHGPSEASVMAAGLQALLVPADRILLEETATDTLSSVRAVRRLLAGMPPHIPVYAMSSGFHLPRCVLLLRLAGVPAQAADPPDFPAADGCMRRWYWRLREAAALPYDAALMLWLRLTGQV
jgi:uncharacterized SAM-binding protein YcdF (DUF218 family)